MFSFLFFPGNIPALTRLLQAYVKRGPKEIIDSNNLVRFLLKIYYFVKKGDLKTFCLRRLQAILQAF